MNIFLKWCQDINLNTKYGSAIATPNVLNNRYFYIGNAKTIWKRIPFKSFWNWLRFDQRGRGGGGKKKRWITATLLAKISSRFPPLSKAVVEGRRKLRDCRRILQNLCPSESGQARGHPRPFPNTHKYRDGTCHRSLRLSSSFLPYIYPEKNLSENLRKVLPQFQHLIQHCNEVNLQIIIHTNK